jgi:hypothetical protein
MNRAYTTCKAQAFAAPIGFVSDPFFYGKNSLCPREVALINAYEKLGRPDMAQLVRKGKKFQRLSFVLNGRQIDPVELLAIRAAFLDLPDGVTGQPTTMAEWIRVASERYQDDAGLKRILSSRGTD